MLLQRQEVYLAQRPPVKYDILSLDAGITPSAQGVPGALEHATPVKPVHRQAVACLHPPPSRHLALPSVRHSMGVCNAGMLCSFVERFESLVQRVRDQDRDVSVSPCLPCGSLCDPDHLAHTRAAHFLCAPPLS